MSYLIVYAYDNKIYSIGQVNISMLYQFCIHAMIPCIKSQTEVIITLQTNTWINECELLEHYCWSQWNPVL